MCLLDTKYKNPSLTVLDKINYVDLKGLPHETLWRRYKAAWILVDMYVSYLSLFLWGPLKIIYT